MSDERSPGSDNRSRASDDQVRAQLDRILAHPEFQATEKMREFLRFVVEETLAGRKHRIKGYTVATRVFGRGDDFDAGQDPIVSIQAGRLRRALERYYLVAGGHDSVVIDIPKGRYVPKFTSQATELGSSRTSASAATRAAYQAPPGPSIAVLPFENLTGDPDQRFMAVGITEELVTELNRFQDLVVIPCHPVNASAGPSLVDPFEASKTAGARFILQGTVRTDPKSVKVSAQLTDARLRQQIWAEAYTHSLDASRLIETHEEIARNVVTAIGSEYGIIAQRLSAESRKKAPTDLDTYEAMLRYYAHQIAPTPESAELCFVDLQRAVEREPEYGPAWSALATLHCQMYTVDVPGAEELLETALLYARKGVSLEPGSQLGRMILAYACYLADKSESFLQEAETALNLNPNSPYTVGAIGHFHAMRGEFEKGLPLLDSAIAANPCHPHWFHAGHVISLLHQHDYEGALFELRKHKPFMSFWHAVVNAIILGKLGRIDEAKGFVEQVETQKPDFALRAPELIRRSLKIDAVVEDIIDGLRKAGMSIER